MVNSLVINGRFVGRGVTGVERFASEVVCAIDDLIVNNEYLGDVKLVIPFNAQCKLNLRKIEVVNYGSHTGHFWEQWDLPRFSRKINADILNLCNTGPIFTQRFNYVVIHDAATFAVPHAYSLKFRIAYHVMHRLFAQSKKARVLTVSNFSQTELSYFLGIKKEKIFVVGESGEHILNYANDDSVLEKFNLNSKKYAFIVSSRQPAKNTDFIIRNISDISDCELPVVVAGGANSSVFAREKKSESEQFIHVGYVSNEQLRSLYENANFFIFPSLYEGYGLPPLEAMTLGCPVLASNAASLPEVCGDAALYFDPTDAGSFRKTFQELIQSECLRDQLSNKGRQHSSKYKWKSSARSILQIISKNG